MVLPAVMCAGCGEIGAVRLVERVTQGPLSLMVYYCATCERTWQTIADDASVPLIARPNYLTSEN